MDASELLRAHGIHVPAGAPGTATVHRLPLHVAVFADSDRGALVEARSGPYVAARLLPLDAFQAASMADAMVGRPHAHGAEKASRTLAHLLVKVSNLFVESGIDRCELEIALSDDDYAVVAVNVTAEREVQLPRRSRRVRKATAPAKA